METLSIGVLIDVVYPFTHGGAEKRVALLGRALAERGHEVTAYSMKWWRGPDRALMDGIEYVAVAEPSQMYANGSRRSMAQPMRYALRAFQGMRGARHDIVDCNQFPFIHLPMARLDSVLRDHALAVTWHEVWRSYWFQYAPFPAGLVGAALEDMVPHMGTNIAVSHHTARRLHAMGAPPSKVVVVPNAIDLAAIDAAPAREEPTDLVYVGRLIQHKRVDRLIAAVGKLRESVPGVRCTIVGTGPEEARLRALAAGLGLRDHIEFTGTIDDEARVLAILKASRVFVSASEREGFGIAALEAMACRLPVVTVDAPMNALAEELVQHGRNGLVTPPRARALAEALEPILDDDARRTSMARAARTTAESYDLHRVTDRLELAYHNALAPARGAPRSVLRTRPLAAPRIR